LLTSGGSVANLIGLAMMRRVKSGGTVREKGLRGSAPPSKGTASDDHLVVNGASNPDAAW
jgi:glutamate/tyrosine decarboxylase-like PLP-dependent enzyme